MPVRFRSPLLGPVVQKSAPVELFGRSVAAAITTGVTAAGLYPFVPAILQARKRRQDVGARLLSPDLFREWISGLACAALRPTGVLGLAGRSGSGPRPIILVHGYVMGRSCFSLLAARLAHAGLGPIIGFEYWTLGPIGTAAKRLGRAVEIVCEQTGAESVDIIGHSMGGLVSRYFAAIDNGARRINRLITLGTPHGGAEVRPLGVGRARKEMAAGSALLERLANATIGHPTEVTIVSSSRDVLVGGGRHAELPGAESIRIDRLNHLEMLFDREVADLIIDRVARQTALAQV